MTNPVKGEVSFESGGTTYIFKLGNNARCLIEEKVDMNMGQWIGEKSGNLGDRDIRLIMWAGLFRDHKLTEQEVGDLIDDIGIEKAGQIFNEAVVLSAAKSNGSDNSRPQRQAKERIGMPS